MIGAIAGDMVGSVYEGGTIKTTDFPLFQESSTFTDDTVLTVAAAYSILNNAGYAESFKAFGKAYPHAGYGLHFGMWLCSDKSEPYNSWGNGSAMRVSPIGFAFNSMDDVLEQAKRSAEVTHNHPEGIKGAQATALSVFLARNGESKEAIKKEITERFNYDLNRTVDQIRPLYAFDVSCQGTVPESIICFLESANFEDAVRKAVSLGGDSDTLGCITGGIAQAHYKYIPPDIVNEVEKRLPNELLKVVNEFNAKYL